MTTRQDAYIEKTDVWAKISAPVASSAIAWRQDGKVTARDGKYFARFVAYVEANTVRERLDSVVAGEWDVTMEILPPSAAYEGSEGTEISIKARLQILGVIRENVGSGRDYKSAATDAFKRAATQFGIGTELYDFDQNWVEVDGDGRYAKPVEDPQKAYERRHSSGAKSAAPTQGSPAPREGAAAESTAGQTAPVDALGPCPKCGGRVWDNRLTKRNPKAPDGKCQNRACDGAIWPPKAVDEKRPVATGKARDEDFADFPGALADRESDDALGF